MSPTLRARLTDAGFWFLLTAIGLAAIQYFDSGNRIAGMERNLHVNRRAVYLICWLALIAAAWAKRGRRPAAPHPALSLLGGAIVSFCVVRHGISLWEDTIWPMFWSVPAFAGLLMMTAAWKEWGRFWREAVCVFLVVLNWDKFEEWIENVFHFSKLSAWVAENLLHLFSTYTVVRSRGVVLTLDKDGVKSAVEIFAGCTGVPLVSVLGTIALLICLLIPMSWKRRLWTMAQAVLIGHAVGFIRVTWLSVVSDNPESFAYWHGTVGAGIFTTGSVVLFGLLQQRHLDRISDGSAEAWLRGGPAESPAETPASRLLVPRITGILATAAAITAFLWVDYARREQPSPVLPETLRLADATQTARTVGKDKLEEETLHTRFERVSDPVTYTYDSGGKKITVELRSIQGLIGGLDHVAVVNEKRELKSAYSTAIPRSTPAGEVLAYTWNNRVHLAGLIPFDGPSLVTSEAYGQRVSAHQHPLSSWLGWFLLARAPADRRVWWVEVSLDAPAGSAAEKSLLALWPGIVEQLRAAQSLR